MNPLEYPEFSDDMNAAVAEFIKDTGYHVGKLTNNEVVLLNDRNAVHFYLDGSLICAEFVDIDNRAISFFDIMIKEGIASKYPKYHNGQIPYKQHNKQVVEQLLHILMTDLKGYL
jgi:hypothetical protein